MLLPEHVMTCIRHLEDAGFAAYAVGGCVRDHFLGLIPGDYDLCTDALPEQIKEIFSSFDLVLAGEKHGTVGVITPDGVIEITTFRTEGGYDDHRHPQWVRFVPRIEDDLSRRDFTVNAMAWSPTRGLSDPFGGRQDLQQRILRTVGDPKARFQEDALRILRGVRFAVRFHLTPEDETMAAMIALAHSMDTLARERVFSELCKLLPLISREEFLCYAPILFRVIPELEPMAGFDQHTPHHAFDLLTHTAWVTAGVGTDLALRWAALLHDIGKISSFTLDEQGKGHFYGHAGVSAQMAGDILRRLKAPNALREQVVALIERHMAPLQPEKKLVRRTVNRMGMETAEKLLALQQADVIGTGVPHEAGLDALRQVGQLLQQLREEDSCLTLRQLAVNGNDIAALGFTGRQIGRVLQQLLEQVLDEQTENERTALLTAAKNIVITQEDLS